MGVWHLLEQLTTMFVTSKIIQQISEKEKNVDSVHSICNAEETWLLIAGETLSPLDSVDSQSFKSLFNIT